MVPPKENTFSWITLLATLSSEKSIAYWNKMRIPYAKSDGNDLMQLAQGCLEVILYNRINKIFKPDSAQLLEHYLSNESILKRNILEQYIVVEISNEVIQKLFVQMGANLNTATERVFDWATHFFHEEPDPIIRSISKVQYILDKSASPPSDYYQAGKISDKHLRRIKEFCNKVSWKNKSLRRHFSIAHEVYKMTRPNTIEMLLQDFFYEGVRDSYWWMDSVEYTLQWVHFAERWKDLKIDIGEAAIINLFNWLGKTDDGPCDKYLGLEKFDLDRLRNL